MEAPRRTETVGESTRSSEGMHVCPSCASPSVQPVEWFEQGGGSWHVDLRCPDCDWWGRGSFRQAEVDSFDQKLDSGAQELVEDLRALTRANMEEEIASFTAAIADDLVLPEDF